MFSIYFFIYFFFLCFFFDRFVFTWMIMTVTLFYHTFASFLILACLKFSVLISVYSFASLTNAPTTFLYKTIKRIKGFKDF